MLDELKHYLFMVKKKLRGRDDFEYLMIEISSIAIKNWVDRENGDPSLTRQQIQEASRIAIAKKGLSSSN
jgi:hypothetical protein